ncbi:pyridoxal-phosphate dependent enzyme [Streptomyces sp. CBG33]|uniref:threonine synthase n=1 Tax=Streptomyces sp. CBG33 TaxID=2762624 RepID=UPI001646EBC1|nr:pyridoxal-phosphate dependent enzyme [Streptomyces sp. CBG33]
MTSPPTVSLATAQRSLGDPGRRYPLWPPLTGGCPATSTEEVSYPVEVEYAYDQVPADLFEARPGRGGLDRWAPLLPPLAAPGLGEGGTPLVELEPGVFVKDESRNPTWSHKDRLNRCTVSAALGCGAPGVVVASSGNHGASAAAFAARAGLRCVVLTGTALPPAVNAFLHAYGAVVLPVPVEARWPLTRRIADHFGLHPVSNLTPQAHTGHAFGAEGYKTVAYELHAELGVPAAVFVPTGYGELLFGIHKGFAELRRLAVTDRVPRLIACEPATGGPLTAALRQGLPATWVEVGPTEAYGINCPVGGYRGVVAVRESGGRSVLVTDEQARAAQAELGRAGLWAELSAAVGLAGLRAAPREEFDGPVVCVSTSAGFKDQGAGRGPREAPVAEWEAARARLLAAGLRE